MDRRLVSVCICILACFCLQLACAEEDSKIQDWIDFIELKQTKREGKIPPPYEPVEKLALEYLKEPCTVLDIGCETGKNAACLIKNGHNVVLLDIVPNALYYTIENLKKVGLDHGIKGTILSKIEDLPDSYGPFKAVVGTYVFAFIPPPLFEQTMKEKILNRVELGGYFVGGFFGEQHAWADNADLTIVNVEDLKAFFSSNGFSILEISEQIQVIPFDSTGMTQLHSIDLIAKRIF